MTWNYRLMCRTFDDGEQWFELIEAYYDDDGTLEMWGRVDGPGGSTADEAKGDLELMAQAFVCPVLDHAELPGVEK